VACEELNRRWIGIEIKEEYCEITKQRILNMKNNK
jgi:DNA modification methylase